MNYDVFYYDYGDFSHARGVVTVKGSALAARPLTPVTRLPLHSRLLKNAA